jgi:hypothetical protein
LRCPAGVEMPFEVGGVVRLPKKRCAECPLRERCTRSKKSSARSVSIHPEERLCLRSSGSARARRRAGRSSGSG